MYGRVINLEIEPDILKCCCVKRLYKDSAPIEVFNKKLDVTVPMKYLLENSEKSIKGSFLCFS